MHADEHSPSIQFHAAVELRVPRGESGTLDEGICTVLERIDGVRAAEVEDILQVRPKPGDIYVSATVSVSLTDIPPTDARTTLRNGFGIIDIERLDQTG